MKSLVSQMFCGRDCHSVAPMKLNDFLAKGGPIRWKVELGRRSGAGVVVGLR